MIYLFQYIKKKKLYPISSLKLTYAFSTLKIVVKNSSKTLLLSSWNSIHNQIEFSFLLENFHAWKNNLLCKDLQILNYRSEPWWALGLFLFILNGCQFLFEKIYQLLWNHIWVNWSKNLTLLTYHMWLLKLRKESNHCKKNSS